MTACVTTASLTTVGDVVRAQARDRGAADFVVSRRRAAHVRGGRAAVTRDRPRAARRRASGRAPGSRCCTRRACPFVVAWLAVTRIGAVAVPISTFSKPDELRDLLARSDAGTVIGVTGYRGNDYVAALRDGVRPRPGGAGARPVGRGAVAASRPPRGRRVRRGGDPRRPLARGAPRRGRGRRRRGPRRGRGRRHARTTAWSSCTRPGRRARPRA